MSFKKLWSSHFGPAFIAGIAVAIIFFFFEFSPGNILLFASLGASAAILTHTKFKETANIKITILSYIIMCGIAILIRLLNLPTFAGIFLTIFIVSGVLSWLRLFHPPAISASLSFLLYEYEMLNLLALLFSVVCLLLLVRFLAYLMHPHLNIRHFHHEILFHKK